jgi:hypothetical protein
MYKRTHRARESRIRWSSKLLEIFEPVIRRGFKSWWAWGIVGEVGLNLYCAGMTQVQGRRTLSRCISHLTWKEMHFKYARLAFEAKGGTRYGGASPFYLTAQKWISTEYFLRDPPSVCKRMTVGAHVCMCTNSHAMRVKEGSHGAQAVRDFRASCTS